MFGRNDDTDPSTKAKVARETERTKQGSKTSGRRFVPSPTGWVAGRTRATTLLKGFGGGILAVVVGVALFFVPTPVTTLLGLAMVFLGVLSMVGSTFLALTKLLP